MDDNESAVRSCTLERPNFAKKLLSNCEIIYALTHICYLPTQKLLYLQLHESNGHRFEYQANYGPHWWEGPSKFQFFCFKSTTLYLKKGSLWAICSFFLLIENSSTFNIFILKKVLDDNRMAGKENQSTYTYSCKIDRSTWPW